MELWDAYEEDFRKIDGITLICGEEIPKGIFHLVCDVVVKHTDGSYLLMRRDPRKNFGGLWELTAGGSALQSETPSECAARELQEETGIKSDTLVEIGRVVTQDTIYVEFLCVTSWDKNRVTLQEGETVAYQWVSKGELVTMRADELVTYRMQRFIKELH